MVPPPTDDRPATPSLPPASPRRHRWLWAIAAIAMGLGGGTVAGWYFLRYRLLPILEAELEPILGRPIELGEIESLGFSRARLGLSLLPPTETDPDRVAIAAIDLEYDLSKLWQRRLASASVTIENPRIYIEQAEDGDWLDLELSLPDSSEAERDLPIAIPQLNATIRGAEVILVPRTPTGELGAEYRATFPEIAATATEDLERVAFNLNGALEAGTLQVAGNFAASTGRLEVTQAQLQAVKLAQFMPLLPLPADIVDELQGEIVADLKAVAQLDDPLATFDGTGTIALRDVVADLPQLKEAVTAVGDLRLQGRTLEIGTLVAQMGALEASVEGDVNLETGYNLTAKIPATPVAQILAAVELEAPPVDVRGAIAATARATGAIDAPQVNATLRTPAPIAIDRATLGILEADARLDDTRAILDGLRLDAPDGGQIRATGDFDLDSGNWSGELLVRELDGEIARPYLDNQPLADLGRLDADARGRGNIKTWTETIAEGDFTWTSTSGRVNVPNLKLADGQLQADAAVAVPSGGQIRATGDFDLDSGDWSGELLVRELDGEIVRPYLDEQPLALTDLGRLNANARGRGNIKTWTETIAEGDFTWTSANGRVNVPKLKLADRQLQADVAMDALALQPFVPDLPVKLQPLSGQLTLQAQLPTKLDVADTTAFLNTLRAEASGQFQVAGGQLRVQDARVQDGRWQLQTAISALPIAALIPAELGQNLPAAGESIALADWQQVFPALAPSATPQLPAQIPPAATPPPAIAQSIDLTDLLQATVLGGQFQVNGRVDRLELETIDLEGSARLDNIASGTITLPVVSLKAGQGRLQLQPTAVRLDRLAAALGQPVLPAPTPVTGELEFAAPVAALSTLSGDNLSPLATIRADGRLNFPKGLAVLTEPLSVSAAWDGQRFDLLQASAPSFQAEGFVALNPQATGLDVVGSYDLSVVAADLDLTLAPLLPPEVLAIAGSMSFNGRVSGDGLRNPPAEKAVILPQDVAIAPKFAGNLQFQNLSVNNYRFDPEIAGTVRVDLEALDIALAGQQDLFEVSVSRAAPDRPWPVEPQGLHLRLRDAEVIGQRTGDEFQLSLANIPLRQLQPLLPLVSIPDIAGNLTGELAVNLSTFDGRGALEIAQLQLAQTFRSTLASVDFTASPSTGRYVLNEGRLQVGESDYRLRAEATLDPENWQNLENMRYQASLEAPQVRLRDVFSMLQLQTVADLGRGFGSATYGDASDLDIVPIELAAASLADRIEHLGKIDRELAVARSQETTATIPPLSEFNGDFALAAEIAGQGLDPATAKGQVTLEGQTWQWGETLAAQEAKISLEIADGSVTLLPLRLAYGKSSIELTGSTDLDFSNLVASLAVREVPIEIARNFIAFPPEIGFGGRLEADVTVSGSPATPNATGEFVVADATLNENPIARVEGGFTYNQSQLLFSAEGSILADSEPVTLVGTVPLQLPNSPVTPPSDLLEIRAVVKDEALAFLDVLTNNQVKWGGGKAAIELDITGSFDGQNFRDFRSEDLVAEGQVTFTDAQIDIATLAEPLTTINGAATFDLQTLSTEGIRAQLGGGEVTITGALPFFITSDDRLTVTASDVKVNALNGLFKSQVEGTLLVGGTALATRIGGNLRAFKGTLDLANLPEVPATPAVAPVLTASSTPVVASAPTLANLEEERDPKSGLAKSLQLDSELPVNSCKFAPDTPFLLQNLQIEAGPLFRVSVPFIADFFTEGNFRVDGPLLDVPKACPEGTVTLTRGTVSIGSTRFRLDNEQEQTATFVPQQGLDPTLDVSLRAQVLEATRQPETSDPSQTEITDEPNTGGNFGAAESIRISAQVQGRATQLLANEEDLEEILILSSNPRRSDGEILSLLGQGVLGGGSALGLASSLTGGLQAAVADALGLSQFSIFPLAVADSGDSAEGDGGASTSIELAAETGIDLTNKVTFSVLAILTQQQPLLYSLRYRVNEKISVRGLTDLSANDSLTVNFETRF